MPSSWQSLALELVEGGAEAASCDALFTHVFERLRLHLGFESGSLLAVDSDQAFVWNKPRSFRDQWLRARRRYSVEMLPLFRVAAHTEHVATDRQAFSLGERHQLSMYSEYVRPLGVKHFATVLLGRGGAPSHAISFSREDWRGFRDDELDLLRRLRPTLSLLSRLFGQDAAARRGVPLCLLASEPLTPREEEIASYVARGLRNAEIANLCGSSPYTVRNQLAAVFRKLGVSTRAELAMCVCSASAGP